MSDHGWPGWPDDDPFDHDAGHDGVDPLAHEPDPVAAGHDGDLFHDTLFPDTTDPGDPSEPVDASDPVDEHPGDGWDDGDEPGHGTGIGDAPHAGYDDWHHDDAPTDGTAPADDTAGDDAWLDTTGHGMGPVGADPDALADAGDVDVFPPAVDVGPLPEPVDGFPWIDTGSLGVVPPQELSPDAGAADSADLAEYAAVDLPPGVDPWAELAGSDDPATSTLARFWHPQQ